MTPTQNILIFLLMCAVGAGAALIKFYYLGGKEEKEEWARKRRLETWEPPEDSNGEDLSR